MSLKSKTPLITGVIIGVCALALIIWDVYAIMGEGREASISHWVIINAYKMPFAVYCFGLVNGVLVGHFFWRMRYTKETKEITDNLG